MNRNDRRRTAKENGIDWADIQRAAKAQEAALRLTPEQARETLARWAAQAHSQEEVDALNRK